MFKQKHQVIGFFRKNALPLALSVCVLGVGVGAALSLGRSPKAPEAAPEPTPQTEQVQAIVTPRPTSAPKTPLPTEAPPPEETPEAKSAAHTRLTLCMPLKGEIIKAFSGDTLVYNATLNMWMTHNGIDIAAGERSEVTAALAGEVTKVFRDDGMGSVVVISHGTNGATVYAGLEEVSVKEGDKLNAGQPLGIAGTPPSEAQQGAHLHFEYLLRDAYADPVKYLGK